MPAKIYVGNLSSDIDDDNLKNKFSKYGEITEALVAKDRDSHRSRGYGYVTYAESDDADAAIHAMDQSEWNGHKMFINASVMPSVFITNLSQRVNDETLRERFSEYGQITESGVVRDRETGLSRGFGFVTYNNQNDANAAVKATNGTEFDSEEISVSIVNIRGEPSYGIRCL
ncbi:hypothetical protein BD770DRAFT_469042 [Pilaira anomala]|nr:hypothetical protein BD770DRAFT_469042 [Pilaira anomala]